jgi:hypothetical protein
MLGGRLKGGVKEESSFLKKRSKKLFPGASHEAGPTGSVPSAAGIPRPECLRRWEIRVRSTSWRSRAAREGKVFCFFFSKKKILLLLA